MSSNNDLVFAYLSLGAQALLPIVLGSFKSLKVTLFRTRDCYYQTLSDIR